MMFEGKIFGVNRIMVNYLSVFKDFDSEKSSS